MAKRLTSIRISDYTTAQLHQLAALYETNQSDVMTMAVSRMYRQDIGGNPLKKVKEAVALNTKMTDERALEIAQAIYTEVHGANDNPHNDFYHDKVGEIETWIKEGDPDLDYNDLPALVAEWREYDTE